MVHGFNVPLSNGCWEVGIAQKVARGYTRALDSNCRFFSDLPVFQEHSVT